jgi:hypothetical protein
MTRSAKRVTHHRDVARSVEIGRLLFPGTHPRPQTRGECKDATRPCPYVSCRHHLALEVTEIGSIIATRPGTEIWDLDRTCSLDVADARPDGASLREIAKTLGVSRERVRQILVAGMRKLREQHPELARALELGVKRDVP